jgi:transcriptional regulator with PAS, ATPase and Fis domain
VLADTGTLFLDEVDSLSPKAQVALLRFLQERKVRALGSSTERSVDVRIIAASNRKLAQLVAAGAFRQDLFYRLNVLVAALPPLRARGGDVLLIAESMLRALSARHGRPVPVLGECMRRFLLSYDWPGNIRELENLIEREFLLSDCTDTLRLSSAESALGDTALRDPESTDSSGATQTSFNYRLAKAQIIAEFDRSYLQRLMQECHGNVSEAARAAGKERRDLGRLLRKYSIRPEAFRPG